jgi:GT2 family glycosyltransferase
VEDNSKQADMRRAVAERNQWAERYATFNHLTRELYPQLSIVIVTYNTYDEIKLCIDSILVNTTYPNYEIIVVDNNSTDETSTFLCKVKQQHVHIKIILNPDNLGFAAAANQGLRTASGEILVLLNSDVIVPRGWLRGMLRCLSDPQVGLVGPVTNSIGNEARIEVSYQKVADMGDFAQSWMNAHRGNRLVRGRRLQ